MYAEQRASAHKLQVDDQYAVLQKIFRLLSDRESLFVRVARSQQLQAAGFQLLAGAWAEQKLFQLTSYDLVLDYLQWPTSKYCLSRLDMMQHLRQEQPSR